MMSGTYRATIHYNVALAVVKASERSILELLDD